MTVFDCPSISELFAAEQADAVERHVRACLRCQALLASPSDHTEQAELSAPSDTATPVPAADGELDFGSVLIVSVDGWDEWLVACQLEVDQDEFTVAPISDEVDLATNWDLLLDSSVLGYEAMVEVWNQGSVLADQIVEHRRTLDDASRTFLADMVGAARVSGSPPAEVPVGPDIVGDQDPRLVFQEEEAERTSAFWGPATLLAGLETFGQLVAAREEELEVPWSELVEFFPAPGVWQELQANRLDLNGALPVAHLSELMTTLSIPYYQPVAKMIHAAVYANATAPAETSLAFARHRRGSRRRQQGGSEAERRRIADEYLAALAKLFGAD